jgi:hypothetical protein
MRFKPLNGGMVAYLLVQTLFVGSFMVILLRRSTWWVTTVAAIAVLTFLLVSAAAVLGFSLCLTMRQRQK